MLHSSFIKSGVLNIPKKIVSMKGKLIGNAPRAAVQDETYIGWVAYALLQAFLIFFGLCLLDWFLFYNIPYLLGSWMKCMSLVCLFAFLIFSGSDLLDIRASSNEYLHIKKSLTVLVFCLCAIIAVYNMKSVLWSGTMFISSVLSWGYVFVSVASAGLFLHYKYKWGYRHLILKSLSAPFAVWTIYILYSFYRFWF